MSTAMAEDGSGRPVATLDRLWHDVIHLAEHARDYVTRAHPTTAADNLLAPLHEAAELSRISARLGYCVAWLLSRRAVQTGELSPDEARDAPWRLGGRE